MPLPPVGRWGRLELAAGYYIYVGSAFGPGGVRARVTRHYRRSKPSRWHMDYLREHLDPVGVWYTYDPRRLKHQWAAAFSSMPTSTSIPGFGCSDCTCNSHLFFASTKPAVLLHGQSFTGPDEAPNARIEFSL